MSQTPTNIDTFNAVVGAIFSELYLSFLFHRTSTKAALGKSWKKKGMTGLPLSQDLKASSDQQWIG